MKKTLVKTLIALLALVWACSKDSTGPAQQSGGNGNSLCDSTLVQGTELKIYAAKNGVMQDKVRHGDTMHFYVSAKSDRYIDSVWIDGGNFGFDSTFYPTCKNFEIAFDWVNIQEGGNNSFLAAAYQDYFTDSSGPHGTTFNRFRYDIVP